MAQERFAATLERPRQEKFQPQVLSMNDIVAIMRAADLAARKHTKQKRKGEEAEPYLNHLIEVASLVAESIDGRPDVIIAAYGTS
jgi:(p)ppGpp synthase/HD superfamily hydrolase